MMRALGRRFHSDLCNEALRSSGSAAGGNEVGRQTPSLMAIVHVCSLLSCTIKWSLLCTVKMQVDNLEYSVIPKGHDTEYNGQCS